MSYHTGVIRDIVQIEFPRQILQVGMWITDYLEADVFSCHRPPPDQALKRGQKRRWVGKTVVSADESDRPLFGSGWLDLRELARVEPVPDNFDSLAPSRQPAQCIGQGIRDGRDYVGLLQQPRLYGRVYP